MSFSCTRPEPFNFTPMAVKSILSGSPHVRPMGRTCGEPDEIKKNTHPKNITALCRDQIRRHTRARRGGGLACAGEHNGGEPVCRQPISLYYPNSLCKRGVPKQRWRE